jgi:hypothetical protein
MKSEIHQSTGTTKVAAKEPLRIFGITIPFLYRSFELEVSDDGISDEAAKGFENGKA